jgi:hypothetical protein
MEIGTAIFLSSIVLALVGLYAVTKDRWAWRQTIKHIVRIVNYFVVLVVVLVVAAFVLILAYAGYQHRKQLTAAKPAAESEEDYFSKYTKKYTKYAGLRLGMTNDEVMYVKGMLLARYPRSAIEGPVHICGDERLGR